MNNNSLLLLFVFLYCTSGISQTNFKEKDTMKMYKNIENYSEKSRFTKFLHKLVFEPSKKPSTDTTSIKKKIEKNYSAYEGKIIRNIIIEVMDPFGFSVTDSTKKPHNSLEKAGNSFHDKTSNWTIKNLLLIKKNKPLDTLLLKDSKRIIRSQKYVRRVEIDASLISEKSDSIDIYIKVLDAWSTVPNFSSSTNKSTFELNEYNFLGFGHQLKNSYQKSLTSNDNAYSVNYIVPNFKNTYISSTLNYDIDLDRNYTKNINIERPFISAFMKWAGGIKIGQQFRSEIPIDTTFISDKQNFKYNNQDFWLGRSFKIFKGNSERDRTTNLITSARFYRTNYLEKASPLYDEKNYYSNEQSYLVGIGIASRQFKQEKYIFNYGIIEDIPTGVAYGLTGGYQRKNDAYRYYFGGRFSLGNFYNWGYLSSNIEYGTFAKNSSEQTTLSLKLIYFTNLIESKKWKFRQFIKPELIIGTNRIDSRFDRVTLNDNYGIRGFNSDILFGTKKLLLTFQTQGYSPWNLGGFRLNPFLSYTFGMLSDDNNHFTRSKMFSQYGAGLVISNDYLVFDSFQISFSFFPNIPGIGENIFKTNAFKTDDIGFQNFDLSKPKIIEYK
ncbi:hypothetical protein [uncultured Flavobacterium sp.]|uniref:hypothetical protein n=1 Tax=uncultured Flavobacterium sp. TaxID=165435 RepID=UPI0030EE2E23